MFSILYEDNHLFIVNKPAGILTQPSGTEQQSLECIAKEWIKNTYQKSGNVFLHAVHRLDKSASGIVVFCKTGKSLERLNAQSRDKQFKKIYLVLVEGFLTEESGRLEHYLYHANHFAQVVKASHPEAKQALLSYRLIECFSKLSLVEVALETGRYHQIRAQLAAIGHPIYGDKKYGSQHCFENNAIALHHSHLQLIHPVTKIELKITAPLPESFYKGKSS